MSQPWTLLLCGLGRHGAIGARPSPACRPGEERCWEEEARLSHPCARRPSSPVVSADAALQPTHTRGRDLSAVRQGKPHAAIGARTGTSSSPPLQPPLDKRMDRSQSGSPEGTSVWPRRPSRRHRRRMRALKKKLEKMHLEQPSEKKNSQPSLPSSITRRLRRRARCLVWQITQAVLEEDDPEKSPRAQKRQLLRLYDGAPEHCGNPSPSLKQILLIMLTLLPTASAAAPRELWAAVQNPPGVLFITPDSPLFPSLQLNDCSLRLPCNPYLLPSQAPLNVSLSPPHSALLFILKDEDSQVDICPPSFPNCLFYRKLPLWTTSKTKRVIPKRVDSVILIRVLTPAI
ncbi:uncharacterized protein LOC143653578 isoform X1 [Tamandua tetradactyla]|uniref:uncharacterized protein LOC143653578 isoform X1 n=1 Tax=Tamandua tetradactyla TaxID=48850 RepID=UPI00405438BA